MRAEPRWLLADLQVYSWNAQFNPRTAAFFPPLVTPLSSFFDPFLAHSAATFGAAFCFDTVLSANATRAHFLADPIGIRRAPYAGYLVFPDVNALPGHEWFYLARPSTRSLI